MQKIQNEHQMASFKLWLLVLIAALVILRIPALVNPILDVDEAIYGLFTRIWFDGGIPYVDCVETKPLGIYFFYGIIFSIFGKFNMVAVHAVTIGVVGLTAYVIGLIARFTPHASRFTSFWAALFYVIFSTTYIPKYIATTIEPVMLLPVALQFYLWLKFEREGKYSSAFLSGLAFSVACLFKFQAGMNLIILIAYLLIARRHLKGFCAFIFGAIPLPLVFFLYLWHAGALEAFIFWATKGNAAYIGGGSRAINPWHQILVRVLPYIASTALVWVLAGIGIASMTGKGKKPEARGQKQDARNQRPEARGQKQDARCNSNRYNWLVVLWFLLTIVPVSMGFRFYGHYFLLLLPPLCILAAPVAAKLFEESGRKLRKFFVIFWIVLPAFGFFAARFFISDIHRAVNEDNLDDYKPIAAYAKAHTKPSDRILVWGYAASVYWYAERLPATRFFWSDLVTGRIPASKLYHLNHEKFVMPEARAMFMDDLARHKPAYIIDTSPAGLHDYKNFPISNYKIFNDYLNQNYKKETDIGGVVFYRRAD